MRFGTRFHFMAAGLAALAAVALLALVPQPAHADQPNLSLTAPDVQLVTFHLATVDANATSAIALELPFPADVLGVQASARASTGTTPTLAVDVLEGGTTLLSAPIDVTAGSVTQGTLSDAVVADEAEVTVDLEVGGSSPEFSDVTIVLTLSRR
ncbi:MAG: hypothetical protein WD341_08810 [Tistlia sp.]|uniref:hypothetical protein n=1 Tax=Tistlia sp. TaxID=3057121 RepID=UPI0034A4B210